MATKNILINRKTGKEFATSDAEAVMKKNRGVFRVKPDTQLTKEVKEKEASIVKSSKDTTAASKVRDTSKSTGTDKKD